jgi:hypothetical protein
LANLLPQPSTLATPQVSPLQLQGVKYSADHTAVLFSPLYHLCEVLTSRWSRAEVVSFFEEVNASRSAQLNPTSVFQVCGFSTPAVCAPHRLSNLLREALLVTGEEHWRVLLFVLELPSLGYRPSLGMQGYLPALFQEEVGAEHRFAVGRALCGLACRFLPEPYVTQVVNRGHAVQLPPVARLPKQIDDMALWRDRVSAPRQVAPTVAATSTLETLGQPVPDSKEDDDDDFIVADDFVVPDDLESDSQVDSATAQRWVRWMEQEWFNLWPGLPDL